MINLLTKISINTKILLLVAINSLGMVLFSLYISNLSHNTIDHLEAIGNTHWPTLDKTKQLQNHFDHLVEHMHLAVSSHEKDQLLEANAELIAIKETLSELINIQPVLSGQAKHLTALTTEYYEKTKEVSLALIENSDDASDRLYKEQHNISERAALISDSLHKLNLDAEGKLVDLLKVSENSAVTTSNVAISGCLFVIILGLLNYWTFNSNLIKPIQKLTYRAQQICEGRLDTITDRDLETQGDEFAQMTQALSNLLQSLQRSNEAIKDQNDKLIATTKAKSAFLANMSHEIRTPLASIVGFSEELLEDQQMPLEQRQSALTTIIRGGNHLRNIINDILDISKIEADKLQITLSPVKLIDLIVEIRDLISMQTMKKGLEFQVQLKASIPEVIDADSLRLKQILLNLCSNACKFSDYGKVILIVEYNDLTNVLTFTVQDSGIGISADELPHVFDEFYQADSSASRKYGGTGLGLPISKKLANMMDGDISAQSTFGKGSTFILKINAGNSALGAKLSNPKLPETALYKTEPSKKESTVSTPLPSNRVNVLLAEDTPDNQRLITMFLKRYNINLVIVDNGKKAIEEARRNVYDIVLMDIQMPYMNGIEATKLLLNSGYDRPIIAVTANAMQDDVSLYQTVGFSHVVAKPIVKKLLIDAIENHIDKPLQIIDTTKPSEPTTTTRQQNSPLAADTKPAAPVAAIAATRGTTENVDISLVHELIDQLRKLELQMCGKDSATDKILEINVNGSEKSATLAKLEPVMSTLFDDDPELLTILDKYLSDLKTAVSDIESAYQAKDWETLKGQMHKVKGTGGAFGYPELSEIAKEIHQCLVNGNTHELDAQMSDFNSYCQRIFLGANNSSSLPSNQQASR